MFKTNLRIVYDFALRPLHVVVCRPDNNVLLFKSFGVSRDIDSLWFHL